MVKHSVNDKQACDMCDKIVVDVQLYIQLVLMVKIPWKKIRLFKQRRFENKNGKSQWVKICTSANKENKCVWSICILNNSRTGWIRDTFFYQIVQTN